MVLMFILFGVTRMTQVWDMCGGSSVGQVLHSLDTTIRDDFAVVCIQYLVVEDDCKSKQTALS